MAKNNALSALGMVPAGNTQSRLSYPMLMALLGASQGATNTGSDWVDLGSGFRAYDNSPKRALMGLVQGGAQGYMGGVLQQRQKEAQTAQDLLNRQMQAAEWDRQLQARTDADIAKSKATTDYKAQSDISTAKAKKELDYDPRAGNAFARSHGFADEDAMIKAGEEAREYKKLAEQAKIEQKNRELDLKGKEQESKYPLIQAQTELTKAKTAAAANPKPKAVSPTTARFKAVLDTIKKYPNFNPNAEMIMGKSTSPEYQYFNQRLLYYGGGQEQPTTEPVKKQTSAYDFISGAIGN